MPRHTDYELDRAAAEIRSSEYPQAVELAQTLLHPPSADEMLARFAKVELR